MILQEISQVILDNPQFQEKLVENINQALGKIISNTSNATNPSTSNKTEDIETKTSTQTDSNQPIVSSTELLDQMIKNILDATEKDPTFDAIIEEVVGGKNLCIHRHIKDMIQK